MTAYCPPQQHPADSPSEEGSSGCWNFNNNQGSKWNGMDRYAISILLWLLEKHTSTSFLKKNIPVCMLHR